MPTPAYVSATNMLKGVAATEDGINISGYTQRWEDPKLYVQDKAGSRTGFARNYDISSTATITGETNAAALTGALGVAFGVAETIANNIGGYGVTAGGAYLDDIEISQERDGWATATANFTRLPDIA